MKSAQSSNMHSDSIRITRGTLVSIDGEKYRLLDFDENRVTLINMSGAVCFRTEASTDFLCALSEKEIIILEEEDLPSVDLSPDENKEIMKKQKIMEELINQAPNYDYLFKTGSISGAKRSAAKQMDIGMHRFNILFTRYLRSGRNPYSLADLRKYNQADKKIQNANHEAFGMAPISEKHEETDSVKTIAFTFGLQEFEKGISVKGAYRKVIQYFYSKSGMVDGALGLIAIPGHPTYKQFLKFVYDNIPEPTIKLHEKRKKEKRNARPHTGNQQSGLTSIGQQYQIDECEIPVEMVDERTREKVVGKAVVIIIFESYAQIIVGEYVGFKNNSNSGLISAILSMLKLHDEEFNRYDIPCSIETVPSLVMPLEFISDCGSEYTSKQCEIMLARHGISIKHATPGTGSEKGGVENVFQRMQRMMKDTLTGAGYITNFHEKAKDPKKQAVVTINELKRISYALTVYLNTTNIPGYTPTVDMVENHVGMTPAEIWKYLKENDFDPTNVTEKSRPVFEFNLLYDRDELKINRQKGIYYAGHNLFYFSNEDWFLRMLSDKDPQAEIRYNPEFIDYVFVRYKNEIHKVPLALRREQLRGYRGMTWSEYDDFYKEFLKCHDEELALSRAITAMYRIDNTLNTAGLLKGQGRNDTKNINENRKMERAMYEKDPDDPEYKMYEDLPGENFGEVAYTHTTNDNGMQGTEEPNDNELIEDETGDKIIEEYSDEELFPGF